MTQEIVDMHQMYVNIANIVYDLSCFLYQGFHDSNEKLFTMFENHTKGLIF